MPTNKPRPIPPGMERPPCLPTSPPPRVKERPILFSGAMVRAILDGRKTQTRRIVKFVQFDRSDTPGYDWHFRGTAKGTKRSSLWQDMRHEQILSMCPYGKPGDRLRISEEVTVKPLCEDWFTVLYHADRALVERPCNPGLMQRIKNYKTGHLRGVSLPPAYARPDRLIITGVCVERLQDISEADAMAEGYSVENEIDGDPIEWFAYLWESINGSDSWAANPWVWVVEFRRCEQ
jgi:hypothetical protein